jgi:tetratricopeptide (TPR) repeat protein
MRRIGRELVVRYVLEGSARRSGNRVRVNAQLIDATTDAHLWTERFDRDTADLFPLQDEITSRIANALGMELIAAEAAQPTEHPDALDYILQGRAILLKPRTSDTHRQATQLFERALALDPQSVEAQYRLAGVLVDNDRRGLSRAQHCTRGRTGRSSPGRVAPQCGCAYRQGPCAARSELWEEAILEYEAALELNHNSAYALNSLGWCKLYSGSIDEAIPLVEQAIRLSPRDPVIASFDNMIGTAYLVHSHTDEAILWFEKARKASPGVPLIRSRLAAAYALRGETERAASELAEARRLSGGGPFSSIARLKAYPNVGLGVPKIRALYEATYFTGLRKAGMPEE